MSSSCGSVCLLVLLGVALAFGNPVHPESLEQIHGFIANELDLKNGLISGHSPFQNVISGINTSCLRKDDFKIMNLTLDVYQRIFTSMEHSDAPELNQPKLKQHLLKLRHMMEKKRHLNHVNHNNQEILRDLHRIQVDDPLVQKRALASFREIYKLADIFDKKCGLAH